MTVPELTRADVWVAEAAPNVPAHRLNRPATVDADFRHAVYQIVCPPGVATGGEVITRARAAELRVFPCCRCFDIDPAGANP